MVLGVPTDEKNSLDQNFQIPNVAGKMDSFIVQGSLCACAQPMRNNVTM